MTLWPEISNRPVVLYGLGLRDYLRQLATDSLAGQPSPEAALAANSVFSPLPLDVQVAILVASLKAAVLINESIHRRPT
jgi:hypothetical protein